VLSLFFVGLISSIFRSAFFHPLVDDVERGKIKEDGQLVMVIVVASVRVLLCCVAK
jgi:hypothetical protein